MSEGKHTPLPWAVMSSDQWHDMNSGNAPSSVFHIGDYTVVTDSPSYEFHESDADDAAFIVRAVNAFPEMLAALEGVRKIISDGAMTGFNCHDGDWAERLFESQRQTSMAIKLAMKSPTPPVESKSEVVE